MTAEAPAISGCCHRLASIQVLEFANDYRYPGTRQEGRHCLGGTAVESFPVGKVRPGCTRLSSAKTSAWSRRQPLQAVLMMEPAQDRSHDNPRVAR